MKLLNFLLGTPRASLSVIAIAIMLWGSVSAQTGRGISVRVIDANGAVVQGATATLTGRNLLDRVVVTNNAGEANFEKLPDGELRLNIKANGFATQSNVISADSSERSISLTLIAGPVSETLTVTAERTQVSSMETAKPVTVVGREEVERKAVNSIGDVFRKLPGTSTVNEGAFQVRPRIRGLDSNRVLILVDGERLNNARTSTQQSGVELGLVETSQVESIEVIRGSGSVLYGTDALGGTINIITKDTPARRENGFRFGATLDTFYSSNERGRRGNLALNGSSKVFAFRLAQSLERFGNYKTGELNGTVIDGVSADGEVLNSQSHGGNTQATGRFFINDTNTLKFNYERRRASNIGSPTLVGVFNGFFPFSNRDKFGGRYDSANITENLARVSVSGYYQTQDRNFTNILTVPPVLPFFRGQYQFSETVTKTKTAGFDLQTDWTFGTRFNVVAGASFSAT